MSKCNFLEIKYIAWIGKKKIGKVIIQKNTENKRTLGLLISSLVQSHDSRWGACVSAHLMLGLEINKEQMHSLWRYRYRRFSFDDQLLHILW